MLGLMVAALVAHGRMSTKPILPPAVTAAEGSVRHLLTDPDSATFRDVRAGKPILAGLTTCGEVNARNKFGGYGGYRRFYADEVSAHVAEDEGASLAFETGYALACGK